MHHYQNWEFFDLDTIRFESCIFEGDQVMNGRHAVMRRIRFILIQDIDNLSIRIFDGDPHLKTPGIALISGNISCT